MGDYVLMPWSLPRMGVQQNGTSPIPHVANYFLTCAWPYSNKFGYYTVKNQNIAVDIISQMFTMLLLKRFVIKLCNMIQFNMQYHIKLCDSKQYKLCDTYSTMSYYTLQFHAILCNATKIHSIIVQCSSAWGNVHLWFYFSVYFIVRVDRLQSVDLWPLCIPTLGERHGFSHGPCVRRLCADMARLRPV